MIIEYLCVEIALKSAQRNETFNWSLTSSKDPRFNDG